MSSTPRTIVPHPNSTAARKWKRTSWTTTLSDRERQAGALPPRGGKRRRRSIAPDELLLRRAAAARKAGKHEYAQKLVATAMRLSLTEFHC